MESSNTKNWFLGINSLRFFLALIVILSHTDAVITAALKQLTIVPFKFLGAVLSNAFDGTSAVIAFFIISGFVIHYPNKKTPLKPGQFWIKRLVRILIPLFIVQLIGIFFKHPEAKVVWSLYCELVYYSIYPFITRIKCNWKIKLFGAYLLTAIILCSYKFFFLGSSIKHLNTAFFNFVPFVNLFMIALVFLPCWLLGVLIAENIDSIKTQSIHSIYIYRLAVFTGSFLCSVARFHYNLSYSISMNLFALLLYKWIFAEINYFKQKQPNLIFEFFGRFSFSLYLCHSTLIIIFGTFLINNIYNYPILLVIVFGFSYIFYLSVEKPSHILAQKLCKKINF